MKILILALILIMGWAWFSGYRIHPENFSYYIKVDVSNAKQEIKLTDDSSVTGTIEEDAADYIKLNSNGLITDYKKTQIQSMKSVAAPDFLMMMKRNYELNRELHPFLTHRSEDTANAKFDHFALEPTRLAEDIKKKNPGISMTDELNRQMAENARARLASYKARQKMMEAEAQNNN